MANVQITVDCRNDYGIDYVTFSSVSTGTLRINKRKYLDIEIPDYSYATIELFPLSGVNFIQWYFVFEVGGSSTSIENPLSSMFTSEGGKITIYPITDAPPIPPTLGSAYVYTNGEWKFTMPYIYPQANTPKESTAYIYTNGSWHECIE